MLLCGFLNYLFVDFLQPKVSEANGNATLLLEKPISISVDGTHIDIKPP